MPKILCLRLLIILKLMFQTKVCFHWGGMISVFYYPFTYLHRNVRKPSQMGGHTPYFGNFVKVTPGQTSGQLNLSVVVKVSQKGQKHCRQLQYFDLIMC